MQRDLIGYGRNPPAVKWPEGARICISVNVAYEEGSELAIGDGDETNEPLGEVLTLVPPKERDFFKESFFEYGSRVGVWRVMNILERNGIPASFFVNAKAFERNPDVARAITDAGHDIVGRGYRWLGRGGWTKEFEDEDMKLSIDVLKRFSGQKPQGWMVRDGPSVHTRELMAKHGIRFDCHGLNDDIPYYITVDGRPMLSIPYSMELNDYRFWGGASCTSSVFLEVLRDAFDVLYAEGQSTPKMMSVGLHCRVIGRPSRSWTLERFIQYAKGFPGVWFATRSQIADWWEEHYPPK